MMGVWNEGFGMFGTGDFVELFGIFYAKNPWNALFFIIYVC